MRKKGWGILIFLPLCLASCASPLRMTGYGSGGTPTQSIEMYDASGKHVGYGKIQNGTVELYKPNSSRMGYGKTGR